MKIGKRHRVRWTQGVPSFSLGFYPNLKSALWLQRAFLLRFYRSQFWRLQKQLILCIIVCYSFIGHNFGDYKNLCRRLWNYYEVLSVTILETTKTHLISLPSLLLFYRSQFWRLQKQVASENHYAIRFIGHNFGDYKNLVGQQVVSLLVLSVTILETTKTMY